MMAPAGTLADTSISARPTAARARGGGRLL